MHSVGEGRGFGDEAVAPLPFYPARVGGWAGSRQGWPLWTCARRRGCEKLRGPRLRGNQAARVTGRVTRTRTEGVELKR